MLDLQLQQTTKATVPESDLIYFDHNGSTPTHPAAVRAMMPFLTAGFGNPSSGHWAADPAKMAIETARSNIANLIGADPSEIVFTSGATEANNMAIKGVFAPGKTQGQHIITSAIEHDAVRKPIACLRAQGAKVTVVPVDKYGVVDPASVLSAITDKTSLISIMMANNETGAIQPVAEIGKIAKSQGIAFHTDAAQAVGKVQVDVADLNVSLLSIAGHKFGAPNGIGALFIRQGQNLKPLLNGAGHENGRRAGTESALLASGFGAAACAALAKNQSKTLSLRDYFWNALTATFGKRVVLNGRLSNLVPNTLNISFPGHVGADLLAAMPHVAATTGSACHAGCIDMSHVLIAMGKPLEVGIGAIRFSLGETNTRDEIDAVVRALAKTVG